MEIRSITFRGSFPKMAGGPKEWFPHIAFAGRSNVGKSSLLNWIFRRTMAKVAKAPGKTRALNFFLVNDNTYFVDLPGYGYAKVGRELKEQWGRELGKYLSGEDRLAGVLSLIDIRHGPTPLDLELQTLLVEQQLPRVVILTKADKIGRGKQKQMQAGVRRDLGLEEPPLVTSVKSGEGRKEVFEAIDALIRLWKQRHADVGP